MDLFSEPASPAPESLLTPQSGHGSRRQRSYYWLLATIGVYFAGLIVFAQTRAYTGDEGFHFLADHLIRLGLRPYLDFFYPQAPLNNYWNVVWMGLFGESWRAIHSVTAVLETISVLLMADFAFTRFPVARWRLAAALATVFVAGLNEVVVEYGVLGQAYGMCLLATVAAFRCALVAVDRKWPWWAMAAGFFASVAAASSLLSGAAVPVIFLWMLVRSRAGNRWWKSVATIVGAAVPFTPVLWLAARGPYQVWFNLIQYHVVYRKLYWTETTQHDLEVMTSWIDSGQALILGLLAVAGILYLVLRSDWPRALRSEFYLSGWLGLAAIAELATAHPTFPRYFLIAVPFLGALAAVGLYAVAIRMLDSGRPLLPVILLAFLMIMGLGKSIYERRDFRTWEDYEKMGRKVMQVTPPGGAIWGDEQLYFITHHRPAPGFEFGYSHKINLPADKMALLHIISEAEETRRVKARMFNTAFSCDDDDIKDKDLNRIYSRKAEIDDCTIFWGPPPPPGTEAVSDTKKDK